MARKRKPKFKVGDITKPKSNGDPVMRSWNAVSDVYLNCRWLILAIGKSEYSTQLLNFDERIYREGFEEFSILSFSDIEDHEELCKESMASRQFNKTLDRLLDE